MSDSEYAFAIPFLISLALIVVGFIFHIPIMVGIAVPLFIIVISTKL